MVCLRRVAVLLSLCALTCGAAAASKRRASASATVDDDGHAHVSASADLAHSSVGITGDLDLGSLFDGLLGGGALTGGGGASCDTKKLCPAGHLLRARDGHVASSNGCGAYGITVESTFPLTPCCDVHDVCYGTCGNTKKACDDAFEQCLLGVCNSAYDGMARDECTSQARMYHLGSSALGCNAFLASQRDACACVPDPTYVAPGKAEKPDRGTSANPNSAHNSQQQKQQKKKRAPKQDL